jgi:hypothetical protein
MKGIVFTISILLVINGFGQGWVDYKVDDNLSVNIPDDFEVIDTLGQHVIKAQIANALIMIQRIPNNGKTVTNIQDEKELKDAYIGFQKGFTKSQKGKILHQEFIEKDGLLLSRFACNATMGEEKQIRHCVVIFIKEHWYAIQFWEVESMTIELTKEREMLFSSIKLPTDLGLASQMSNSTEGSAAYKAGVLFGVLLGYTLIIGFVVWLIFWIFKK